MTDSTLLEPTAVKAPVRLRRREQTASSVVQPVGVPTVRLSPPAAPPRQFVGSEQVVVRGTVRILGERFHVELDNGTVFLSHPSWSLTGGGASFAEAERDLISEARELRHVLSEIPPMKMSWDALQLRNFVLKVGP